MTSIPTPFASERGRYSYQGLMSLDNLFVEQVKDTSKAKYAIVPSSGMVEFSEPTDTPLRGGIFLSDLDLAYTVHASSAYKITSAGVATRIGTIPGIENVQMVRNQKDPPQISVRTNVGVYVIENDQVSKITDTDLPDVLCIATNSGYTIFGIEDRRFFLSSINETTEINGLDFATFEQYSGRLVNIATLADELYGCCDTWIEVWRQTGNADFPYEPISNGVITKGLMARDTLLEFDNSLAFVSHDGLVCRLNGYQPQRISNHEIERLIADETDKAGLEAQTWTERGHTFYQLTGTDWSRCYDAATGEWHSRSSYRQPRWRGKRAFLAWQTIMGDRLTGKLMTLSATTYTEDGGTMVAEAIAPTMHAFPMGGITDALHIDTQTGEGALLSTATGYDPSMMLLWSKDAGRTFPVERQIKIGMRGTSPRVVTRRLGRFKSHGVIWKFRWSDPVPRSFMMLDAKVRPLKI